MTCLLLMAMVLNVSPTAVAAAQAPNPSEARIEGARPLARDAAPSEQTRILSTFAGALVGFAGPALLGFADTSCLSGRCFSSTQGFLALASPLLGPSLASGIHSLMGGKAGFGAGLFGAIAASGPMLGLHLLMSAAYRGPPTLSQSVPIFAADMVVGALLTTLALELRHSVLSTQSRLQIPGARFAAETVAFGLSVAGAAVLTAVLVQSLQLLVLVPMALTIVAGGAFAFLVHSLFGGKGTFWNAMAGLAVAVAMGTGGALAIAALSNQTGNTGFSNAASVGAGLLLTLGAITGPSYALEFGHQEALASQLAGSVGVGVKFPNK